MSVQSSHSGTLRSYLLFIGRKQEDVHYREQRERDHRDENNRPDDAEKFHMPSVS
jgi:hypothetical protein